VDKPNVRGALWGLTSPAQFALLAKAIVDHEVVETNTVALRFHGTLQPEQEQAVVALREGERTWKFWRLLADVTLPPDSVVQDDRGLQYRVMGVSDWSREGYWSYRLAQMPPQSAPAAAYASGTREPIKVVADALQAGLGLAADAVVLAYEKNVIPAANGLYVSLDYVGPSKCVANVDEVDADGNEIQSCTYSHLVQIDLLSYDASARRRKEEATMALHSVAARQLMEAATVSIARVPSGWVDASSLEPTQRLQRFIATVRVFAVHRVVTVPALLAPPFAGELTTGGPLTPFLPGPLT
jgi:hypothetical protein